MKILIADDDCDVLDFLCDHLSANHAVVARRDGEAALRAFEEEGGFDFVLSDYQMPRKNGVLLLMEIRQRNPGQRMALQSGDPPKMPKELADVPVLRKPWRLSDLMAVLEKK
jgi:CheY-like chemotaxis protein